MMGDRPFDPDDLDLGRDYPGLHISALIIEVQNPETGEWEEFRVPLDNDT